MLAIKYSTISFRNPYKEKWDVFIIILAIYNSVVIPLDFVFFPQEIKDSVVLNTLNNITDSMFIIDIIIMFFTTYTDSHGKEIDDRKSIAYSYIKTWRFVFDILPIFHFFWSAMGLFKLVRVRRLSVFI